MLCFQYPPVVETDGRERERSTAWTLRTHSFAVSKRMNFGLKEAHKSTAKSSMEDFG